MGEIPASLAAGVVIYEHFIVEGLLGTGDFGSVYLVRDQRDEQKRFALAELLHPVADESYRFALNYVSRAPLDRHVLPRVQYIYHDNTLDRAYVLMNYIEEPNLETLRLQQAEQHFPLSQVLQIMTPVVNAVIHLHQQHTPVIHGNITPLTIIMSQSIDEPVLVMLDLFKEHDLLTTPLHYFTPGYGAVEQYEGKYSERSDVYGLGATYYTLLTGIVPPDALSRSTRQKDGESDPLRSVHEVVPAIPATIAEVIQQSMSLNADDRFSSVEQFQSMLASLAEHQADEDTPHVPSSASLSLVSPSLEVEEASSLHSGEPGHLRSPASGQADEEPALVPAPEKRHATGAGKVRLLLIALAILLIVGVGTDFWLHLQSLPPAHTNATVPTARLSSPTPAATATPVSSPYPTLAGTYRGTIYDVSVNVSTDISLNSIQQNQDQISGYLALGSSIQGSGRFKGTIDATKRFQFIVIDTSGNPRLFFEGIIQSPTALSGDYYNCNPAGSLQGIRCTRATGSYGIWNAVLT